MAQGIVIRAWERHFQARPRRLGSSSRERGGWRVAWLATVILGCARPAAQDDLPQLDAQALQQRVAAERGRPLLLAFWATWCDPCVEEFPVLATLHRESPDGLRVLAVSLDGFLSGKETPRVVAEHLQTHPARMRHVIYSGTQDALFSNFDLPGNIPYSILYGADGQILQRFPGAVTAAQVRAALQRPANRSPQNSPVQ